MTFPSTYHALARLALKKALQTRWARAIARKAGLHTLPPVGGVRTVIDASIHPLEEAYGRQYIADLSGATEMRLSSTSNVPVWVRYSVVGATSTLLEMIDAATLHGLDETSTDVPLSAQRTDVDAAEPLGWLAIPSELRVEMRLLVSTRQFQQALDPLSLDGPFAVLMQVR